MKYLLDVSALIAWRHHRSPHHAVFHRWARHLQPGDLATCAHVELSFVRVSMQAFALSVSEAEIALADLKRVATGFIAVAPTPKMPAWVIRPKQTSDAYLMQIAASAGLELVTFDTGIPGAVLIQ